MNKDIYGDFQICISVPLKEKDKAIYSQPHKDFLAHITKSLDDFLEISDIRDLVQFFVEEENKSFNRRITKFVKYPNNTNYKIYAIIC